MKTREELIKGRNLVEKQIILEKEFLRALNESIGNECFNYEYVSWGGMSSLHIMVLNNKIWVRQEKIYINDSYDKTLKVYFEIADFKEKESKESIGFSSLDEFKSIGAVKITQDAPKGCRFKLGDLVSYSSDDEFEIIFKKEYPKEEFEKWQEKFDETRTQTSYPNGGKMEVIGFVGEKILLHHDDYGKFSLVSDSDLISQQEINDIIFRSFKNVKEDISQENKGYYDWKISGIDDNGHYLKYRGGHYLDVIRVKIFKC
jgi:hypothetical protein